MTRSSHKEPWVTACTSSSPVGYLSSLKRKWISMISELLLGLSIMFHSSSNNMLISKNGEGWLEAIEICERIKESSSEERQVLVQAKKRNLLSSRKSEVALEGKALLT